MKWTRCRALAIACAFAAATTAAHADLWVFRDESGKAHFAPTQVDPRYELFYKGKTNLYTPPAPAPVPPDFDGPAEIIRNRVSGHPNVARYTPLIEQHAKACGLDPRLEPIASINQRARPPRSALNR